MGRKTIVFDLDDTLVKEIDYLKSAFFEIAVQLDISNSGLFDEMFSWYKNKEDVFLNLERRYEKANVNYLKSLYRKHIPNLNSKSESRNLLVQLKKAGHFLGLITDGFSVTQRNKLQALDIEQLFDRIIISEEFGSEKPCEKNFLTFHELGTKEYFYIGDNVSKDFITPNKLGWTTVCLLNNGENIHIQDFVTDGLYLPFKKIHSLTELPELIKK